MFIELSRWVRRRAEAARGRSFKVTSSGRSVLLLGCLTGCTSATTPAPSLSTPDPQWIAIDSILNAAYPPDAPGAAAVVVRDGRVLYRGAAGLANLEHSVAMRPEMVFPIFSVSKQFTAAAILLLQDEGKLRLTDTLGRFFPDYPAHARGVSVAQLMAHTSGLPNFTEHPAVHAMLSRHVSKDELIALFRHEPLMFAPGSSWEYSNSGYVLLGAIIEQVSGMSYGAFVRARILRPLGLNSTYVYDAPNEVIPLRVSPYTRDSAGWKVADYFSLTHGYAIGNLLSSVDDLARWNGVIERSELLSQAAWERASTAFPLNGGESTRYGAGWFVSRLADLETLEHAGNFIGGVASVVRVPGEQLFVAILTNADPPATDPEELARALAARVLGVSVHPTEVPLAAERLDEYVGVYRVAEGDTRIITRAGSRLYSQRTGGQRFEIYSIGDDLFYFPANGAVMRFERESGRVMAVTAIPRIGAAGPRAQREP